MAHEFWIEGRPFAPAVGAPTVITLSVGEYFVGERVGVTASHAASFRALSQGRDQDLGPRVPKNSMLPALTLSFPRAGSHVLAYESHPSEVTLPADKFHAYLRDEGLDEIIRLREAAGAAARPGRERFRRSAKMLLRVGGRADGASTLAAGQRLELTPLSEPLDARAGDTLRFSLRFEGRPQAGVLVKAWHMQGAQTTVLRARTGADGVFALALPFAGAWMLNAVHMAPAVDAPDIEWDSFWSSLSFDLAK